MSETRGRAARPKKRPPWLKLAAIVMAFPLSLTFYGLAGGAADALVQNGSIHAALIPFLEVIFKPERWLMNETPLYVRGWVQWGDFTGYDFAGGPETTR